MKKTRIVGRIIAGAVTSAILLTGALASPAQAAKDSNAGGGQVQQLRDTGWNPI
ncbi:MAG TPA: hypothetical protein VLB29_17270 [Nocardioidaceae bacterium]|nr:hypothetical protein [Nocardioidaceae bacterium]